MSKLNFNDHLDDMMERLMNEDLTSEQLELEVKRSKALVSIAGAKIEHDKLKLQAIKLVSAGEIKQGLLGNDLIGSGNENQHK